MKKLLYLSPLLLLAPMIVSAADVNTNFNNESCVLTVSGSQTGHDATVSLFDDHNKDIGFKTGEIVNGNYSVDFVLSYENETTINITVSNESGESEKQLSNVVIPACDAPVLDQGPQPYDPQDPGNHDVVKDKTYTVSDEAGNTITFKEENGHEFRLRIFDFYGLNDIALTDLGIPRDLYDMMFSGITNAVKNEGTLIAFLQIEVEDENGFLIHEGPFNIKIKLTDEMKKFNSFKIIYVDTNNNFNTQTPIELKINGDYLEGTLEHLSEYALVGNVVDTTPTEVESNNPKTGDNVMLYIGILGLSVVGLVSTGLFLNKNNANK